jgi:cysteine-rich repeat protein
VCRALVNGPAMNGVHRVPIIKPPNDTRCSVYADFAFRPAQTGCGDGVLDPGEACDDGNLIAGDGCSSVCAVEACGNSVLDAGEECDPGFGTDPLAPPFPNDYALGSTAVCDFDCTLPVCGDAYRNEAVEECDDGNTEDGDGCSATCQLENLCP